MCSVHNSNHINLTYHYTAAQKQSMNAECGWYLRKDFCDEKEIGGETQPSEDQGPQNERANSKKVNRTEYPRKSVMEL